MQGARGCPAPERAGWLMGERGRGVTPFRSIPPLHSGVPPNFGERKGRLGRGRSPGLESRGLSWARGRGGGLSVPRGAGWSWRLGSVCVGGGGRGSERIAVWRYWKARMFRGAYTPQECGEDPGQGCVRGVRWSPGSRPRRVGGRVCGSRMGLEAGDPGAVSRGPEDRRRHPSLHLSLPV